jgi:hypothetical protein
MPSRAYRKAGFTEERVEKLAVHAAGKRTIKADF